MADSLIRVAPDSTGKAMQTYENTVAGEDVHAEAVVLVDQFGTPLLTFEAGGGAKLLEIKITDPFLEVRQLSSANFLARIEATAGNQSGPFRNQDESAVLFDSGAVLLAIRKAIPANIATSDGNYDVLQMDGGKLWVKGDFSLPAGAATEGKQDTQITGLAAILAKIIAAPATEAKQDTQIATLGATTGVAVTSDLDGTLQQYLRGIVKQNAGLISPSLSNIEGRIGALTAPAPATDTASAALNGRLQRIAQHLTSLIALLPSSLGGKTAALSLSVTTATDDPELTLIGSVTETAPASDTASSGLNGRLQRIAQRITSFIALLPASLGQKTMANSLAVTLASDQSAVPVSGTVTTGGLTDAQLRASAVPVSAASLPLPAGAATSALQAQPGVDIGDVTVNNAAGAAAVNIQDGGNSITVDGPLTDTQLRATAVPVSGPLTDTQLRATAVPVSAAALPLPSGASTAAKQPTLGTALAPSTDVITTQRPAVTQVVSTAFEASHILKASAGQLVQLSIFNSGAAQFILLINATSLPANGAVTLLYPPIPIAAATLLVLDLPAPLVASTGIVVCNSSTGSFTKTIGAGDCAFYAQVN